MNKIKQLRILKDKQQKEIADLLNVTPRQIQRYEKSNAAISVEKALQLSEIFNVSLDYMFNKSDSEAQTLFSCLDDDDKQLIIDVMKSLSKKQK
ncbi:hypothetical protein HMI01_26810 [Halolactibacillus miurensis]|uniref:DNA-binding transcriptional regulator, XRE-family HTH domain n=1 Tax=Halolactibacillus miurensis TaxID=306541 RepID=A0A1I6U2R0_9BACI|nr:helix-turn-helix transcriptional regulator [Halolactibacillus miurensis]GEM05693.1 hypothetical protein HMI01_26810 [Halolactibacillus miurensis]SFS95756.1 DNA-binding transcriptional regulator, XRE-family HTH domain [Halolactibacillus miurensis]